jgi:hypothetical protein
MNDGPARRSPKAKGNREEANAKLIHCWRPCRVQRAREVAGVILDIVDAGEGRVKRVIYPAASAGRAT